jgi:hypothetical protein
VRRRCFKARTVVVWGAEMSSSRSGWDVEKRIVRWRGGGRGCDDEAWEVMMMALLEEMEVKELAKKQRKSRTVEACGCDKEIEIGFY